MCPDNTSIPEISVLHLEKYFILVCNTVTEGKRGIAPVVNLAFNT